VMRTSLMKRLGLSGKRFDIEPEITGRILRLGYRIHEVPIDYYARSRAEGKKLTWLDGVKALGTLTKIRLTPRRRLFGENAGYHRERQVELAAAPRLPVLPGESEEASTTVPGASEASRPTADGAASRSRRR
jgi:hypothetical protein